MEIVFSHITSLEFLRQWSRNHPLTLREFHDLRPRDTGHLPASRLRSFRSLARAADTETAVRAVIEDVQRPSLKRALEERWARAATGHPLHTLAQPKEGRHPTKHVRTHQLAALLPRGAFLEIAPGVAVCSPELAFIQMAEILSFGGLIALGYELCGCYPLDTDQPSTLVRSPLTTPDRIASFANRAARIKGVQRARVAARFVRAKSASVKETEMAALLLTPARWGGMGLPPALANESVALSKSATRIGRSQRAVCDLLWPQFHVAVEYDGLASHTQRHQQAHDSRRRDALTADGLDVIMVTSSQIDSISEFIEIANAIARKAGRRIPDRPPSFHRRHLQLRHELRVFHHTQFSPPRP